MSVWWVNTVSAVYLFRYTVPRTRVIMTVHRSHADAFYYDCKTDCNCCRQTGPLLNLVQNFDNGRPLICEATGQRCLSLLCLFAFRPIILNTGWREKVRLKPFKWRKLDFKVCLRPLLCCVTCAGLYIPEAFFFFWGDFHRVDMEKGYSGTGPSEPTKPMYAFPAECWPPSNQLWDKHALYVKTYLNSAMIWTDIVMVPSVLHSFSLVFNQLAWNHFIKMYLSPHYNKQVIIIIIIQVSGFYVSYLYVFFCTIFIHSLHLTYDTLQWLTLTSSGLHFAPEETVFGTRSTHHTPANHGFSNCQNSRHKLDLLTTRPLTASNLKWCGNLYLCFLWSRYWKFFLCYFLLVTHIWHNLCQLTVTA